MCARSARAATSGMRAGHRCAGRRSLHAARAVAGSHEQAATRLKALADAVDGRRKSRRCPCTVPIEASLRVSTVCDTPRDKVFSVGLNEVVCAPSARLKVSAMLCLA